MDIDRLLNHHVSDKHSQNGYGALYHALFKHMAGFTVNLLEIGIGTVLPNVPSSMYGHDLPGYKPGASLRAWGEYFINGLIYGIDTQPDTMAAMDREHRIYTALVDSTDPQAVLDYTIEHSTRGFHIIIDDGSHHAEHQLATLKNFYPHLRRNGFYIIEDVQRHQPTLMGNYRLAVNDIIGDDLCFVVTFPKADVVVISARSPA